MHNCFRRKLRIPVCIVVLFTLLFVFLFYKHIKNVHQRRQMLSRFLSYDQFLGEVMSNVNELNKKINESESNIRRLSKILSSVPHPAGNGENETLAVASGCLDHERTGLVQNTVEVISYESVDRHQIIWKIFHEYFSRFLQQLLGKPNANIAFYNPKCRLRHYFTVTVLELISCCLF